MKPNFSHLKWSTSQLRRACLLAIEKKKKTIKEVLAIPTSQRNFHNIVEELEDSNNELTDILMVVHLLSMVHEDKKFRNECVKIASDLSIESSRVHRDKRIYEALLGVAAKKEKLSTSQKRLFHHMLIEHKNLGLALSEHNRDKLSDVQERITTLELEFLNNINNSRDSIKVSPSETKGLSKSYLSQLSRDKAGNLIVTTDYPDFLPFVQFAENADKRKELFEKNLLRAGNANLKIAFEIIKLRERMAELLGYANFAALQLELRMIKDDAHAQSFVSALEKQVQPKATQYVDELRKLKRKDLGKNAQLEMYDLAYYANKYLDSKFGVDLEKLREFFPLEKVTKGILEIYQNLLGLKFAKKTNKMVWHKSVTFYEVFDAESEKFIGNFFMDMYPREGKYSHACVMPMVYAREENGKWVTPAGALIVNFTKSRKDQPSLLTRHELRVFFHEFGHMMHLMLSRAKYISQAATNVAWDFVEAPSQMLEYWLFDKNILKQLAKIPAGREKEFNTLVDALLESQKVGSAYEVLRQITVAEMDLNLHTRSIKDIEEMRKEYGRVVERAYGIRLFEGQKFLASLGHFVGYQAGYYGYMWSKTIAADLFTLFEKEGFASKKIGQKYRKEILEPAGMDEPEALIENFLGRKMNNAAFVKRLG